MSPCFTGWETDAVAATLGALPSPASLEKSPRLIEHQRNDLQPGGGGIAGGFAFPGQNGYFHGSGPPVRIFGSATICGIDQAHYIIVLWSGNMPEIFGQIACKRLIYLV